MGAAWIGLFSVVAAAIITAIIGPALERRRRRDRDNDPASELDVMLQLTDLAVREMRAREAAERRAAECEDRERRRRRD